MTYHSSSLPANTKNSIPEKIRKSIYSDHFGNLWENFNSKTQNNFPNIKTLSVFHVWELLVNKNI